MPMCSSNAADAAAGVPPMPRLCSSCSCQVYLVMSCSSAWVTPIQLPVLSGLRGVPHSAGQVARGLKLSHTPIGVRRDEDAAQAPSPAPGPMPITFQVGPAAKVQPHHPAACLTHGLSSILASQVCIPAGDAQSCSAAAGSESHSLWDQVTLMMSGWHCTT